MGTPSIGSTTKMTRVAAMMALEYTSPKESIHLFIFGLLACKQRHHIIFCRKSVGTCGTWHVLLAASAHAAAAL